MLKARVFPNYENMIKIIWFCIVLTANTCSLHENQHYHVWSSMVYVKQAMTSTLLLALVAIVFTPYSWNQNPSSVFRLWNIDFFIVRLTSTSERERCQNDIQGFLDNQRMTHSQIRWMQKIEQNRGFIVKRRLIQFVFSTLWFNECKTNSATREYRTVCLRVVVSVTCCCQSIIHILKGHLCLRRVFSLITKIWSKSFDFALSLLLTHVVYMKTNIIMCDRQWFT